ncbi:hypothetical protein [Microbacterium testaceum]|uniref:hypothetical protein n=1 Tax=Microbacterium testaceum TaxID=2033 RepID=UPI001D1784BC|nr:hypothetical protein [Microbacterium testaceum]MCC4247488.1 hypothetical protein [Microbacterium testaceum]
MADPHAISNLSPIKHLTSKGFPTPPWARNEHLVIADDGPKWNYQTSHLTDRGVQDIAWLLVDGWDVRLHARHDHVIIRIQRKEDQ